MLFNLALSDGQPQPSGSTEESNTSAYGHRGDYFT